MKVLSAGCWVLGGIALAAIGGCSTDDPPSPYEIVRGTGTMVSSKAVNETTYAQITVLSGRSGSITVNDDSTLAGWIKLSPADSQHHFTGTVTFGGSQPMMAFSGITPWKYRVLTNGDFPDTYGLVSDTVLVADIVGDATPEHYRVYMEFHK